MDDHGHNRHGPLCPFRGGGGGGSLSNTMSPGPRSTSIPTWHLHTSSHLAQQIWAKNLGAVPLWGRGAGSLSNTVWPGPRPTSIPTRILIYPAVGHNRHGSKMGREAGSKTNTMLLGSRPNSVPSGMLIHPAIWPQHVWAKNWGGGLFPLRGGGAGSPSNTSGCLPYFHTWCGLSANLRCRSETCCTRLTKNTGRKKVAKNRHQGTIAQLRRAISSQLRHISTIGKKTC